MDTRIIVSQNEYNLFLPYNNLKPDTYYYFETDRNEISLIITNVLFYAIKAL